ncbi:unnamed protein product [Commensalibacter communis]|uniref:Uncharacterized protein n=1 Tax=Commensalibacter communis TaxID=2972786 RepID=A0A9W4X7B4_9PROT|nr:hypothetical protein [Commensalibacter communis]CAI3949641.1 unnamed protein product [Commensalibacter communis]CAI3953431.1 unnamed protein product [Commensalibacter communis]CAI3953641.1 unnamed protein product [Commensalibacter communis]CAI3953709.1 unnamed protein product [Commensalibacter communis]CAI3956056.1 unnamed protein product [Commensalibacter communis]
MDYIAIYHNASFPQSSVISKASQKQLSCQQFLGILADLKVANDLLATGHYQKAIHLFDKNITIVGQHYLSPTTNISDDTGTKLILGQIEQKKGRLKRAAYLKRNVLESRVSVFQENNQCQ